MRTQLLGLALCLAPACTHNHRGGAGLSPGNLDQLTGTYVFLSGGDAVRHHVLEENGVLQLTTSVWNPTWGEWQERKERTDMQFSHVTEVDELQLRLRDEEQWIQGASVHSYFPLPDSISLDKPGRIVFFIDPSDGKKKMAMGAEEEGRIYATDDHLDTCRYNGPFLLEQDLVLPQESSKEVSTAGASAPLEEGNTSQIEGQYITMSNGKPRSRFVVTPEGEWITFKESSWKDGEWKASRKDLGMFKFSHAAVVDELTLLHGPYHEEVLEGALVHSYFPDIENLRQQLPWRILFLKHPQTGVRYLTIQFEPRGAAFRVRKQVRAATMRNLFELREE